MNEVGETVAQVNLFLTSRFEKVALTSRISNSLGSGVVLLSFRHFLNETLLEGGSLTQNLLFL